MERKQLTDVMEMKKRCDENGIPTVIIDGKLYWVLGSEDEWAEVYKIRLYGVDEE